LVEHRAKNVVFKEFRDFVVDVMAIEGFTLHQDLKGANVFIVAIEAEGDVAQLVDGTQEGETLILWIRSKRRIFVLISADHALFNLYEYIDK
jgi:ribosome-binding factor A